MSALNFDRFRNSCGRQADNFYSEIELAVCRNSEDADAAFRSFQLRIVDGVVFNESYELKNKANILVASVLDLVGNKKSNAKQVRDMLYKAFSDEFRTGSVLNSVEYRSSLFKKLQEFVELEFNYVGPCNVFDFHGVDFLVSDYVSVVSAASFLSGSSIPKSGKNWVLREGVGFDDFFENDTFVFEIGGLCWDIKTRCPKDNVRLEARRMAECFMSLIRVALTPSDYCHRARIGQVEPAPNDEVKTRSIGAVYNDQWSFAGARGRAPRYKITERFAEEFNSPEFQAKLQEIFGSKDGTLARRVFDGLSWLARGRQSDDVSERLLYFFTAVEALLSADGAFAPVSDSIARYLSVILSDGPNGREEIYDEMKTLYNLRSKLVHRGERNAHSFNANNVEHFAERAYSFVIRKLDLTQRHSEFLIGLRTATHGGSWPLAS